MSTEAAQVRQARPADLGALLALEKRCFSADRISPRSMRRLLSGPSAIVLVIKAGEIFGYALLLTRRGSSSGRLYSIAIDPSAAGKGAGSRLLAAVEKESRARGLIRITLEVREDNAAAIALYRRSGYLEFGRHEDYYADGAPALRFGKALG